jgi:magnesium transporter
MITWLEITGEKLSALAELGLKLGIHPLALEDCFHKDQRPKLEDFENHQYLVWFMMAQGKFYEIQFVIFPDKILFVCDDPPPKGESWRDYFKLGDENKDVWHMVYHALDSATDSTWSEVKDVFQKIEDFEQQIFTESFHPKSLLVLKKRLSKIENLINHLPSVIKQIQNFYQEKNDLNWKLRDLHDHCERMYRSITLHSAQIGTIIELYWGHQADRTNRHIKKLSLLASIAIPMTFWASFWGMNFTAIPFSSPILFFFALGIMVSSVIITVWFLIKKGYWSD